MSDMSTTGTAPSHSPQALRAATTVGWVSWTSFVLATVVVTSAALLERRTEMCASAGTAIRNWAFELVPFAQLCTQSGSTQGPAPGALLQTAFVGLALVAALVSGVVLAANARVLRLSKTARVLLVAQASSVVLAGLVVARSVVVGMPSPSSGVDLGLVWGAALACALATVSVAVAQGIIALVKLGRTSS